MNLLIISIVSLIMGILVGILSARTLIAQATDQAVRSRHAASLYPFIKLSSFVLLGWYLLRWGPVPFILFGGGLILAMWVAIVAFTY